MFLVWTNYSWRRPSTGGGDERSLPCSPCPGRLLGATLIHPSAWKGNSQKFVHKEGRSLLLGVRDSGPVDARLLRDMPSRYDVSPASSSRASSWGPSSSSCAGGSGAPTPA